nr:hypothetical protein [Clostridia bacterium]
MKMAKNFYTPVEYWVKIPLKEFTAWIRSGNDIIEEENAEIEKARARRRR